MYVRNCWYVAAWDHEVPTNKPVGRILLGEPIVLYRTRQGGVVGLADRCAHRFAPLSLGEIEGDAIRCLYHGLKFGSDGRCVDIPNQDLIPDRAHIRAYPVVERDNWIWVWMGSPEAADPSLIPRAVGLGHPEWVLTSGQKDFEANWELLNDNLCDLTHLAYVHRDTLGKGAPGWADAPSIIRQLPRGLRVERWLPNAQVAGLDGETVSLDQWTGNDFLAPGVFLLETRYYPSGTAAALGFEAPGDLEPLDAYFSSQAVTPISEQRTRYFYSMGPHTRFATPEAIAGSFALVEAAFEEDRLMEEGQQRIINLSAGERMLTISTDVALNAMRKIMRELDAPESRPVLAEV